MSKTPEEMKKATEDFFANAFCAKKATLLEGTTGYAIVGVIEIETGDKRGTIHVARLEKLHEK